MRIYTQTMLLLALVGCGDDADKDGIPTGEDCNDTNPAIGAATDWYADSDGDKWGTADDVVTECEAPPGYVSRPGDCDDLTYTSNPDAKESCNEADDDCDGEVDEGFDKSGWFADADGDGFGDPTAETPSCTGAGLVDNDEDCDDTTSDVSPNADEFCNDIDDDCDGTVDEDDALDAPTWYLDQDGDGFGVATGTRVACEDPGSTWAAEAGDCDDTLDAVWPGADELCNGIDDDCDGVVDGPDSLDALTWYYDQDRDGYGDAASPTTECVQPEDYVSNDLDCDDTDRHLSPETEWYADADGDGYGDPDSTTAQCTQPSGYVDDDKDCDDTDDEINPKADEYCDEVDNDCDGNTDDSTAVDATTWYADLDGDGYGNAANTITACDEPSYFTDDDTDCDDTDADVNPAADEICDYVDNDCDGDIDYDDSSVSYYTWYADTDEDGYGDDDDTTTDCWEPSGYVDVGGDCDVDDPEINPGATEVCDAGIDNDCDGDIDLDDSSVSGDGTWYDDTDGDGYGDPDITTTSCTEPSGYVRNDDDCDPTDATVWDTCWAGEREFTTCGATGYQGPSQTECDTEYSGTTLDGEVTVSSGIQEWEVPWDGTYVITCYGAQGAAADTSYQGGNGAMIMGSFDLEEGDILYIAVGQEGTIGGSSGGGGGGSFVVNEDDDPLIIAAGGGGTRASVSQNGCGGLTGTYAGSGSGSSMTSSCAAKTSDEGEGGAVSSTSWGSAGGGFNSDGDSESYATTLGGSSWANGLLGGYSTSSSYTAHGGFGAGGSGNGSAGGGGGGGYSGGDGGRVAGAGGSYNDGDDASSTGDDNSGDGSVTIDLE